MSKPRVTPHRPPRDTSTREAAELKREVERLKRQVARLRKQVEKLEPEPEDPETGTKVPKASAPTCPKCLSSELGQVSTPSGKIILSCRACKKWRSKPLDSL